MSGPINLLFSYHSHGRSGNAMRDTLAAVPPAIGSRVLLDSGAFSARSLGADVQLPDLIAWYHDCADLDPLLIGLDVIGDQPATRANCERMRAHGLDVLPTVHLGASPTLIPGYARDGWNYLALGGLVNGTVPHAARAKWVRQCQREAQDCGVRLHGLGWTPTHPRLADTMKRLATADSSTYTAATRYGQVRTFTGSRLQSMPIGPGLRTWLKTHPQAHDVIGPAISHMRGRTRGDSFATYGLSGYAYHRWGEALGTPIYLAAAFPRMVGVIADLITHEKERTPA